MSRPAVFDNSQPPRDDLMLDAIIEENDAIGNVFLDAKPSELAIAALGCDDGSDALVLEPAEKAPERRRDNEVPLLRQLGSAAKTAVRIASFAFQIAKQFD